MDALNYPYIEVRDVAWLKKTLLLFPHVARMTPLRGAPADAAEIAEFCWTPGGNEPLLRPVDLEASGVRKAQLRLMAELEQRRQTDPRLFERQFGRHAPLPRALETDWQPGQEVFRLHTEKMLGDLEDYLLQAGLAWAPDDPGAYGWVEMHPRLGAGVMTTLAMACAKNEGLRIVTEFPAMHGQAIGATPETLLDRLIADEDEVDDRPVDGQRLAEVVVYQRCNVDDLTAADMKALRGERDAFAQFRTALEGVAKDIPKGIENAARLQAYLDNAVNKAMSDWEKSRSGFGPLAKEVFGGEGAIDEPAKLIQKLAESALVRETGATAVKGAFIGGLTAHALAGAGIGCIVGLGVHTMKSWERVRKRERESPWKYLTTLTKRGVVVRTTA